MSNIRWDINLRIHLAWIQLQFSVKINVQIVIWDMKLKLEFLYWIHTKIKNINMRSFRIFVDISEYFVLGFCFHFPVILANKSFEWFWQVCRDPRWGRCYESFSEDTEIVRKMTSIITGLQGQPPQGHPKGYPFVGGRF